MEYMNTKSTCSTERTGFIILNFFICSYKEFSVRSNHLDQLSLNRKVLTNCHYVTAVLLNTANNFNEQTGSDTRRRSRVVDTVSAWIQSSH